MYTLFNEQFWIHKNFAVQYVMADLKEVDVKDIPQPVAENHGC